MEERKKIFSAGALVVLLLVFFTVIWFLIKGEEKKEEVGVPEVEEKDTQVRAPQKKEKKGEIKQNRRKISGTPLEIIEFGWRPVSRTLPNPGFIWEWAVELENKTNLHLKLIIKFELLDENGNLVGEAVGGEDLAPEERKIVIGRASSSDRIIGAKKVKVSIKVSPSNMKNTPEEIEENWKWRTPFEVSKEKELGFSR